MAHDKTGKAAKRVRASGLSKEQLAGRLESDATPNLLTLQALTLSRRFGLSPTRAGAVALLAFAHDGRRA